MKRFTSPGHAQRFLAAFSCITHFWLRHHRLSADVYRREMTAPFTWNGVVGPSQLADTTNRAEDKLNETILTKLPANQTNPDAKTACTAPCKWRYACSPPTPNTGSPTNSTPYLQDPNEYRAAPRDLP